MNIVFFTREKAVCQQISGLLESDGHECRIIVDESEFYLSLTDHEQAFDLFICDFKAIPHQSFNIYEHLIRQDRMIPVIFYNDPFPSEENRCDYWLHTNENLYQSKSFNHLIPFFKKLNSIIESPELHPYISLLQPALSCSCKKNEDRKIDLIKFRKRNNLSPTIFKVFEHFYKNQNRSVSVKDLRKVLWSFPKRKSVSMSSIYSYISRLRKQVEKDKLVKIDIIRTDFASYEMVIY